MSRQLVLEPFRAIRYSPEVVPDLATVTAPPYDMLDSETTDRLRRRDPYNVVNLTLPTDGPDAAGQRLRAWRSGGVLVTDPDPALYGYEQRSPDGMVIQRGVLGALGLRRPSEGIVLPHEDVMPGPVAGRLALLRASEANLEPLLLMYDGIDGATRAVLFTPGPYTSSVVSSDGYEHRIWRISEPETVAAIALDLRERQALIGDGHHRYAAALALQRERGHSGPSDSVLALLVDHDLYPPELGAIHRTVDRIALETVLDSAEPQFAIAPASPGTPTDDGFLVTDGEAWYLLRSPEPNRSRPDRSSAGVVDDVLLRSLLGIPEDRAHYIHDRDTAVRTARRSGGVAFLLSPVSAIDVFELARRGIRMPRKSTSFGPKPRTGLVMRAFDP